MVKHSVKLELSDFSYQILRHKVESGEYESESEAIEFAILGIPPREDDFSSDPLDAAFEREIMAAYDEDVAHPSDALTPEELEDYLTKERPQFLRAG